MSARSISGSVGYWNLDDSSDFSGRSAARRIRRNVEVISPGRGYVDTRGGPPSAGAACSGTQDAFFPEGRLEFSEIRRLKSICRACPIRPDCLEYALTSGEDTGVWGGTTPGERKEIKKVRRSASATRLVVLSSTA